MQCESASSLEKMRKILVPEITAQTAYATILTLSLPRRPKLPVKYGTQLKN